MLDVYKQAELKPDAESKGRVLSLLRLFGSGEPSRKRFVGEMVGYVFFLVFFVSGGGERRRGRGKRRGER